MNTLFSFNVIIIPFITIKTTPHHPPLPPIQPVRYTCTSTVDDLHASMQL